MTDAADEPDDVFNIGAGVRTENNGNFEFH